MNWLYVFVHVLYYESNQRGSSGSSRVYCLYLNVFLFVFVFICLYLYLFVCICMSLCMCNVHVWAVEAAEEADNSLIGRFLCTILSLAESLAVYWLSLAEDELDLDNSSLAESLAAVPTQLRGSSCKLSQFWRIQSFQDDCISSNMCWCHQCGWHSTFNIQHSTSKCKAGLEDHHHNADHYCSADHLEHGNGRAGGCK